MYSGNEIYPEMQHVNFFRYQKSVVPFVMLNFFLEFIFYETKTTENLL